jgi:hypothetical protein
VLRGLDFSFSLQRAYLSHYLVMGLAIGSESSIEFCGAKRDPTRAKMVILASLSLDRQAHKSDLVASSKRLAQ